VILEAFVPDADSWRLIVAIGVFLVGVHAYCKLSPFFAVTWLGAGLVFGTLWGTQWGAGSRQLPATVRPEVLLLPVLLFYLAAAVTKGLVETRDRLRGNHVVHVLMTGLFGGLLALPVVCAGRTSGWALPVTGVPVRVSVRGGVGGVGAARGVVSSLGVDIGGVPLTVVVGWMVAATAFYGTYKILDHVGLSKPLQTVLLFAAMPFLVQGVEALNALL
jgi:hypothetical protein